MRYNSSSKILYTIAWNIAGAFLCPNGIRINFQVPFLVTKARNYYEFSSTGTYQKPLAKSILQNTLYLFPKLCIISSMVGRGYLIPLLKSLTFLRLTQKRRSKSGPGLGATTTELYQALKYSLTTPNSRIFYTSSSIKGNLTWL